MMGHPAARWCSPRYLRSQRFFYFALGLVCGELYLLLVRWALS